MKKLIALLGGLTITTSTAAIAVSCTNYDRKIDGNSVLVQFLQSMDGVVTIDASDVLWQLINTSGPEDRENFLIQLLRLINVSILSNSEANFSGDDSILDADSVLANQDLGNALITKWNSVNAAVDLQIQRERDSYQRTYGRNWERNWRQMLVDKFPVYQQGTDDMDLDFLEEKYKADILMNDSTNGATKALLDVLINTDSYGVTWITAATVFNKFTSLKGAIDNENNFEQILNSDPLAIQQIQNAGIEDASNWINQEEFTVAEARNVINLINLEDAKTWSHDVPENVNTWSVSGASSRAGMLSNSQLFFLNKYYETKAPVAITEVVISFSDNQSFDDGITIDDFTGDAGVDLQNTNRLWNHLLDDVMWDTALVNNNVFTGIQSRASIKTYDSLLTLTNSDYSDTLKTVVYDYILNGRNRTNAITENSLTETVINSLNRTNDSTMYRPFGNEGGRLAYIDTDGLHIIRIEGYEYFGAPKNTERSKTIVELQQFNNFHSLRNDQEKIDGILSENPEFLSELNTGIEDPYLQFLVNSSLLTGLNSSPISYDIMNEVKAWAVISNSSSTETYWITAIFDYFQTTSTISDDLKLFISKFLVFGVQDPSNAEANEIAQSMEQWTVDKTSTAQLSVSIASSIRFVESFRNWRRTIQSNTGADYPNGTLAGDHFGDSELAKNVSELWSSGVLPIPTTRMTMNLYILNQIAKEGDVK